MKVSGFKVTAIRSDHDTEICSFTEYDEGADITLFVYGMGDSGEETLSYHCDTFSDMLEILRDTGLGAVADYLTAR